LVRVGIECTAGVVKVPVKVDGEEEFAMSYQHDLIIKSGELVKLIGSVKTSSKDRLDKIFVDKFFAGKTHWQRCSPCSNFSKRRATQGKDAERIRCQRNIPARPFKGYTVKLNPLDGVYYFDIRPNMLTEKILKDHIRTFDHFLFKELWGFLKREALIAKVESADSSSR